MKESKDSKNNQTSSTPLKKRDNSEKPIINDIPPPKKKFKKKESKDILWITSLIFNHDIDRVWKFVRDLSYLSKFGNISHPIHFCRGVNNTWTLNTEFSFLYINIFKISCKCIEIKISPNRRLISWDCKTIGISYIQDIIFYKTTDNQKTLVKLTLRIKSITSNIIPMKFDGEYFKRLHMFILKNYSKILTKSSKHLIDYQSFIIKDKSFEKVWTIVTNFKNFENLTKIFSDSHFESNSNDINGYTQVGNFWKCQLKFSYNENSDNFGNVVNFFIVKNITLDKKKKKGVYVVETFGTENTFEKQEVEIKVIKVFPHSCQVSFTHTFKEKLTDNYLIYFRNIKRDFMIELKKKLKNL